MAVAVCAFVPVAIALNLDPWTIVICVGVGLMILKIWGWIACPPRIRNALASSAEDYLLASEDYEYWESVANAKYLERSMSYLEHGEAMLKDIPAYQQLRQKVERALLSGVRRGSGSSL
ncbi:MAG: hypothetical protein P8Z49_05155 [Acidobacteriota bacterium]